MGSSICQKELELIYNQDHFNSCGISSSPRNDFTETLPTGLIFSSQVLTKGNPKPALAQLTDASCSFSTSAIGLARFEGGNSGP